METTVTQYEQMHIIPNLSHMKPILEKKWHEFHYYYGMNSIITMEVHYTACEDMDCFLKFNVFPYLLNSLFLLPFLPQRAASRLSTNLYQLYVYWKYSHKISTWISPGLDHLLNLKKIKTKAKMTNEALQQGLKPGANRHNIVGQQLLTFAHS